MNFIQFILSIMIYSLISGCNGEALTTTSQSTTYNGNNKQARISINNQSILVRALFNGIRAMTAPSLLSHHLEKIANENVVLSNIKLKRNCLAGGNVLLTGVVDAAKHSGELKLNYAQCYLKDAQLNGSLFMELQNINSVTLEPTDMKMFYDDLTQTISGKTLTSNGIVHLLDKSATAQTLMIHANLFNHSPDGQEIMYQALDFVQVLATQQMTVQGSFCEGINGCVSVTTLSPLSGDYTQGQLLLSGKDKTKLRLNTIGGSVWMELDSDGDNEFESVTQYN